MSPKRNHILVGLTEIAGYATYLTQGLESCNQKVTRLVLCPSPYFDVEKTNSLFLNIAQHIGYHARLTPKKSLFKKIFFKVLLEVIKPLLLIWSLFTIDTYIFIYGQSFIKGDLWLLKKFGKKIIIIFNGTESRPPYLNAKFLNLSYSKLAQKTRKTRNFVRYCERFADACIAVSHQGYFHTKSVYIGMIIGQPSAKVSLDPLPNLSSNKNEIRIFHSASHRTLKGTHHIASTIQQLKDKGWPIHYIEVENMPHEKLLNLMNSCDIVIDQLYSDAPHSIQSNEGMALGKAVIVGGYYAELMPEDIPKKWFPPNYFILPEKLDTFLESLLQSGNYYEIGAQAKDYATTYLSNQEIAKRYLDIIEGVAPDSWLYNPYKNRYIYGIGIPKPLLQKKLYGLISQYGKSVLCLEDKPELEALFLEFAKIKES